MSKSFGKINDENLDEITQAQDFKKYWNTFKDSIEICKKWTMPIQNWGIVLNQFMLIFEQRLRL